LGFSQITNTLPLRLIILHFEQIGLTDGRTFMKKPPANHLGTILETTGQPYRHE